MYVCLFVPMLYNLIPLEVFSSLTFVNKISFVTFNLYVKQNIIELNKLIIVGKSVEALLMKFI